MTLGSSQARCLRSAPQEERTCAQPILSSCPRRACRSWLGVQLAPSRKADDVDGCSLLVDTAVATKLLWRYEEILLGLSSPLRGSASIRASGEVKVGCKAVEGVDVSVSTRSLCSARRAAFHSFSAACK
jgi:hypothetical protein